MQPQKDSTDNLKKDKQYDWDRHERRNTGAAACNKATLEAAKSYQSRWYFKATLKVKWLKWNVRQVLRLRAGESVGKMLEIKNEKFKN